MAVVLVEGISDRIAVEAAARVLGRDQADELYQQARRLERIGNVADLAPLFSPRSSSTS